MNKQFVKNITVFNGCIQKINGYSSLHYLLCDIIRRQIPEWPGKKRVVEITLQLLKTRGMDLMSHSSFEREFGDMIATTENIKRVVNTVEELLEKLCKKITETMPVVVEDGEYQISKIEYNELTMVF